MLVEHEPAAVADMDDERLRDAVRRARAHHLRVLRGHPGQDPAEESKSHQQESCC